MSDGISVDGKEYISSKRASEMSGYTQDYIGQISRKGLIDSQRIGGLWYVSMDSLIAYKTKADAYIPTPPQRQNTPDPDSLITFDGKDYISASRAAVITGYHQDYVGQLARSGNIPSRQVGNRWYVEREAIVAHKKEKDRLLAAVQTQSVGLASREPSPETQSGASSPTHEGPYLKYTKDDGELMPLLMKGTLSDPSPGDADTDVTSIPIPIRVTVSPKNVARTHPARPTRHSTPTPVGTLLHRVVATAAFTIVIVLTFGSPVLSRNPIYAFHLPETGITRNGFTASAGELVRTVGDVLEKLLTRELIYDRSEKDF